VSANYVEMAEKVFILNCPFATVVRQVLKQVVPARSQHKLAVLGEVNDYKPVLQAHAEVSEYHDCLFGGALPEGLEGGDDETMSWPRASVAARDKKVVLKDVSQGHTLMWSCCPESMDVGLEIKFVGGGKTEMLFNEAERVSTLKRGVFFCPSDGVIHLTVDNTFSYLKGKVVTYNFELVEHELTSQKGEELTSEKDE